MPRQEQRSDAVIPAAQVLGLEQRIANISQQAAAGRLAEATLLGLVDTPDSYEDQAGRIVRVKSGEDGLEFGVASVYVGVPDDASELESGSWELYGEDDITIRLESDGGVGQVFIGRRVRIQARLVATSNLDLSGTETIDGGTTSVGEVVLAAAQTAAAENGPWVVSLGAWTRPPSWDPQPNDIIEVREGGVYADTLWQLTNNSAPAIGTDSQTWRRFDGKGVSQSVAAATTISRHTFPRLHVFITASANPGFTLTLPSAADYAGGEIVIKSQIAGLSAANRVRVTPPGAETLDGAAFLDMAAAYNVRRFISNGANWFIAG